jgi:hypothetical protein
MTMTTNQLRDAIETYPQRLYEALKAVEKAENALEKIEEQIEEEEAMLLPLDSPTPETPESDEERIETERLDYELAQLDLRYEQLKGSIELEYRRHPPAGDKVTEATVSAYVKSNDELVAAKERCLAKKYERDTLNKARRLEQRISLQSSRSHAPTEPVTSPKLERLRLKQVEAEAMLSEAERKVEETKADIQAYQLLVQLYTAGVLT